MPTTRRPRLAAALVAATVLGLAQSDAPAWAQRELDDVESQIERLDAELDAATGAYEQARARAVVVREELDTLRRRAETMLVEAAVVEAALGDRARALFKRGGGTLLTTIVSSDGPEGAIERAALVAAITRRQRTELDAAAALHERLGQARALIADREAELSELERSLAEQRRGLERQLALAEELAGELRAVAARQRTVTLRGREGTYACIFDGSFNFRDTWGAPRSGGRRHKGTDVFSYHDAPVYAFTTGRIARLSNSRLGGLGLYLAGDDGNLYYYAHLAGTADGIAPGVRVDAGELVAYNGDSGNARGGPPHVHYELHPGGGGAVNPYPALAAVCH